MSPKIAVEWPKTNTTGWVRLEQYAHELATRIDLAEPKQLVIAAPFDHSGALVARPRAGVEFFIGWTLDRAALEIPVSLVSVEESTNVQSWVCKPIGEPIETQRRNFVRVKTTFEVGLDVFGNGSKVKALAIDLSEGGLRASIDRWATDPGLRRFEVQVPVKGGEILLDAQVVWWGNLDADGYRTVGIRFVEVDTKTADAIRRHVFALQLAQRRNQ